MIKLSNIHKTFNPGSVNEVYALFFQEHKPARSTVAVKTLPKNVMIEIEAVAAM